MIKRLICVLISITVLISTTSCSIVDRIDDAVSAVFDKFSSSDAEELEDMHQYTASPYEFPILNDGAFKSVPMTDYFGYNHLTDVQKHAYFAIYDAAIKMDYALFYVGECSENDVVVAMQALMGDAPQLMWVPSNYGISVSQDGSAYVRFEHPEGEYGYLFESESERNAALDAIYAEIDRFVSQSITHEMSQLEIEIAVHDWICEMVEYDDEAAASVDTENKKNFENAWTVYGAFVDNKVVCAGYSRAFQLVMNYLGINCVSVLAKAGGEMHLLSIVNIDGNWMYVDPTWNDKQLCDLEVIHDYFNLTYEQISDTHEIFDNWKAVINNGDKLNSNFNVYLPECNDSGYSYYKYTNCEINSESEFKNVVVARFAKAKDHNVYALEFRLTYCDPDNDYVKEIIEKYDIIKELNRYYGRIKNVQYTARNNGSIFIKINK